MLTTFWITSSHIDVDGCLLTSHLPLDLYPLIDVRWTRLEERLEFKMPSFLLKNYFVNIEALSYKAFYCTIKNKSH